MTLHVVIVGAGIGGASSAIMLNRLPGVKVSLYERDVSEDARTQGFSLSIQENGISALKKMGLFDAIVSSSAHESPFHMMNKDGKLFFTEDHILQIERGRIRDIFHETLKNEGVTINFDHRCTGYEETKNKVIVKFENRENVECDILIAADGSRSAIRHQMFPLSSEEHYLGLFSLRFTIPMEHKAAEMFKETQSVCGRGCRMISKVNYPNMTVSLSISVPHGQVEKRWSSDKEMIAGIKQIFVDQHFFNADAILALDVEPQKRYIMDKDPLKPWKAGRVMLIGDSCHPMSPFMGQGANNALEDSVELGLAFEKILSGIQFQIALTEFEKHMLKRSTEMINKARFLANMYTLKNPIACYLRNKMFTAVGHAKAKHQREQDEHEHKVTQIAKP